MAFDIPSQPLGAALEIYARISNREVLYDGEIAVGRRSGHVQGVYAPEVALQILLAGTGLWAAFKDTGFFVVGFSPAEQPTRNSTVRQSAEHMRYYGILQASLSTAFCGTSALSDSSRIVARLWIGQTGDVLQVRSLSSTGDGEQDLRLEKTLLGLRLRSPPPAGFAQPVTIAVLPNAPDQRPDCDGGRTPARTGHE